MSATATLASGRYRVISLVRGSLVGVERQGPGPDQPLRLNQRNNIWGVSGSSSGYDFAPEGYRYTGLDQRVPGLPVLATDDQHKEVKWIVRFVPEADAYVIEAAFNKNIVWTVQISSNPEAEIVADPLQAGPPPTQLFRIVRVD